MLSLIAHGHTLDSVYQSSKVVGLQLSIFHALLCPVLVQSADAVLRVVEVQDLISHTFLDEDAASVLIDDRLFVL